MTITGAGTTLTVGVTQPGGATPSLSVSTYSLSFVASGGQKSFDITSNINWSITRNGATWFNVSNPSGLNNATITLDATANPYTSQRTATLTITGAGKTQTIYVTQAGSMDFY